MEMESAPLVDKAVLVVGFIVAVIILERLFPAVRPFAAARFKVMAARMAKNMGLAGLNAAISPLIVIPLSAVAASWSLDWRPAWWTGGSGLIFDLLLLDLWIYWWHRANHEVAFLWRFHEVHHLDEFLDATSAVRFHAGEVVLSALVRAGVIFLLDVPLTSVVVFETVLLFATVFHHSNLKLPVRLEALLSRLVVTPAIHWVHHHAIRADTDSNYATVLSIWDRLFSTRSATKRWPEMPIGVEKRCDEGLFALLIRPFRRRRAR